jgi:hypothetical protein
MASIFTLFPTPPKPSAPVSLLQLYLLRAAYLLLVIGVGIGVWPTIMNHPRWDVWQGVGKSVFAATSLVAILGIRYPLKMLPLLLFELIWKTIWFFSAVLPIFIRHGRITTDMAELIQNALLALVFLIVIPWDYVYAQYIRQPGDPWR